MALLKIARMGHPVLMQVAAPVADPTAPELQGFVADMIDTMEDAGGAGLAAPQVYMPLRLFVFRVPAGRDPDAPEPVPTTVLINPEIEELTPERELGWEGCLSIPGLRAAVPRCARIRYRGYGLDGQLIEAEANGFHARVVQHEFDHLNGVLYPSRVEDFRTFGFDDELSRAQRAAAASQAASEPDA